MEKSSASRRASGETAAAAAADADDGGPPSAAAAAAAADWEETEAAADDDPIDGPLGMAAGAVILKIDNEVLLDFFVRFFMQLIWGNARFSIEK